MDIADFEVIEYTTRSNPSVPGDPSMYSVELSRLEFEMVEGVWYQFMDRKRSMAKQLETVFSKSEITEMSDVPSLQFAVLKSDTVELARAGLSGKIIVPDYANRALANRQPMGVVDVRSVGGVTYAAISHEIGHPRFHRTISLVDGLNPHQDPWDDVKVAFDFNDTKTDDASDLLDEICEEDAFWPVGWSWVETFASSTHMMVIFRVEGAVRRDDGRAVRKLLNDIEAGIDPREARSETSSRKR
jgi:hypothetical protein